MKVLGAFGSKTQHSQLSSYLLDENTVIDAGNLIQSLGEDFLKLENLILTHAHFDHIVDLPTAIDTFYAQQDKPLKIFATQEVIDILKEDIFNDRIWPDFSKIPLFDGSSKTIEYHEIEYFEECVVGNFKILPYPNFHTFGSSGFIINDDMVFTSDTFLCYHTWDFLNENKNLKTLVIEVSFPSAYNRLAVLSKHLTPTLLQDELKKLKRDDVKIYINHIKYEYYDAIIKELKDIGLYERVTILDDGCEIALGDEIVTPRSSKNKQNDDLVGTISKKLNTLSGENKNIANSILQDVKDYVKFKSEQIAHLNDIGMLLSVETDLEHLLSEIISKSKLFTNADGGTLYIMSEDEKELIFKIVETDSLGIHMGLQGEEILWPPVPLYLADENENHNMAAAHCALSSEVLNFEDVYDVEGFDFGGTKKFDEGTGFRSKSMLVIPMVNSHKEVIGVMQLINARDDKGEVISFTHDDEKLLLSLASQAAVAITNAQMIKDLKELLDSFIKSIAFAVDQKSPYTGGHVNKVASISLKIAKALNRATEGKYADVNYTKQEIDEIRISALMHDIGKITTPQHVMDKATKLETLYDRIETVKIKFETLKKDMKIDMLQKREKLLLRDADAKEIEQLEKNMQDQFDMLDSELQFLEHSNIGGEFMRDEDIEHIKNIANKKYILGGVEHNLLSEDELYNLCIRKGTLTSEELEIMHDHARVGNEMLNTMPFPKHLKRVPSIAGGHHEKLNGKGYPNGLMADELSLESRILALADIFEALSAADRPYKEAKKMSEIMKIIDFMVKDGELDGDLVQFFYDNNIHHRFAKQCFRPEQIDIEE